MSSEQDTLSSMPCRFHQAYLDDDGTFDCPRCLEPTFDFQYLKGRKVCPDCAADAAEMWMDKKEENHED